MILCKGQNNGTCYEGEKEDKWKRCEQEQVQQFLDK